MQNIRKPLLGLDAQTKVISSHSMHHIQYFRFVRRMRRDGRGVENEVIRSVLVRKHGYDVRAVHRTDLDCGNLNLAEISALKTVLLV